MTTINARHRVIDNDRISTTMSFSTFTSADARHLITVSAYLATPENPDPSDEQCLRHCLATVGGTLRLLVLAQRAATESPNDQVVKALRSRDRSTDVGYLTIVSAYIATPENPDPSDEDCLRYCLAAVGETLLERTLADLERTLAESRLFGFRRDLAAT